MIPQRCTVVYWMRIVGANILASLFVVVAFSGVTLRTPPREILVAFGVAFVFSSCIGPLLGIVIPRIAPVLWRRLPFPLTWVALAGSMVALAIAGSAAAITILTAIGYVPPARFFEWLAGSLRIAIVVTLTIGLLFTIYEIMQERLHEATLALRTKERDESEARRLAAEAQLASLESRVQPHFLFNTLNSIAALIHDDPAGAERMTGQLAALLRSSLDQTPLVTVGDELRMVRDYLEIERVRFGDRLRYRLDIEPAAEQARIPKLVVQTLVENSVKYAVSARRDGASVIVRANVADGRVRIAVEDDGPGFDASRVPPGHGLALVRSRLAMTLGASAKMDVVSRTGLTSISIEAPITDPSSDRNASPASSTSRQFVQ
jgi:two-component system sensor histidine kinase AlgZ